MIERTSGWTAVPGILAGAAWTGACVAPGQSFYVLECGRVRDGVCDEPSNCVAPADAFDCGYCATVEDGTCDEPMRGTDQCPVGTDLADCEHCPTSDDGWCDEDDGTRPEGTDDVDCCAVPEDGVCEEIGFGGSCEAGSDFYDCGYCPETWIGDGTCDSECPEETDAEDCFSACAERWLEYHGPCFVEASWCGPSVDDGATHYCFYDPAVSTDRGVCAQECTTASDCFSCEGDWLAEPICYFNTGTGAGVCVTPCESDSDCRAGQGCNGVGGYSRW